MIKKSPKESLVKGSQKKKKKKGWFWLTSRLKLYRKRHRKMKLSFKGKTFFLICWGLAQLGFKLMVQIHFLKDDTAGELCDGSSEGKRSPSSCRLVCRGEFCHEWHSTGCIRKAGLEARPWTATISIPGYNPNLTLTWPGSDSVAPKQSRSYRRSKNSTRSQKPKLLNNQTSRWKPEDPCISYVSHQTSVQSGEILSATLAH